MRITSDQPEKDSTCINKNPTPVMYAWSICSRLHGYTSLGHKYKVVGVKFLNSLNFLRLFIYSSISSEYNDHHASNFILFFCIAATPQWISSRTIFITNFLCVSGEIIRSPFQITPCSIVMSYFFVGSLRSGTISPYAFSYSRCYPT